jgi:preprotein translocase subunit SecE
LCRGKDGSVVKPLEFVDQVRTETRKVVWASRKQTLTTALMVIVMTSILGLFFLGVDRILGSLVHFLLSLAKG